MEPIIIALACTTAFLALNSLLGMFAIGKAVRDGRLQMRPLHPEEE